MEMQFRLLKEQRRTHGRETALGQDGKNLGDSITKIGHGERAALLRQRYIDVK